MGIIKPPEINIDKEKADAVRDFRGGKLLFYYCCVFSILMILGSLIYTLKDSTNIYTSLLFFPVGIYFLYFYIKKRREKGIPVYASLSAHKIAVGIYFIIFFLLVGVSLSNILDKPIENTTNKSSIEQIISPSRLSEALEQNIESTPSATTKPASNKIRIRIQTDNENGIVNVRYEAKGDAGIVSRVSNGEEFEILKNNNGWYLIELDDGKKGWIDYRYTQKVKP